MSHDGTRAVSCSIDKTLNVWDLTTGTLIRTLEGHADVVMAVVMSHDGTRAVSVSGSRDKTLKVWDLTTGTLIRTLEGHADGNWAVAMSPDGTRAVPGSGDKTLKVWDLTTDDVIATFAADYPLHCCGSSPRAETLMVGDTSGRVHFLRLEGMGSGT
jgi:WD40 repeat protein